MLMIPDDDAIDPAEEERRKKEDEELLAIALTARKEASRLMELGTETELARRAAKLAKETS